MKKVLLVAALVAALGLGSASFATYAGVGFGYGTASTGFWFFGQFGDWNMLSQDLGLRGRVGGALGGFNIFGAAAEIDVTYNLTPLFNLDIPLVFYVAGGPAVAVYFTDPLVFIAGVGVGGGVQYNFTDSIGAFLELKPLGLIFTPVFAYNFGVTSGVNFSF